MTRVSIAAAVAAISGAAVWGSGWLWSRRDAGKIGTEKVSLVPARVSSPGAPAEARLTLRLPLYLRVGAVAVEPGENSVLSGAAEVASSWRWSYRIWRVRATIRPLGSGKSAPGKLVLELAPRSIAGDEKTVFEIPPIEVDETAGQTPEADRLLLAEKEAPIRSDRRLWYLAAPIVTAILLLWWYLRFRRRKRLKEKELPPWETARLEIFSLRSEVASKLVSPVAGVERLADVVRRYLEARFGFPASRQTTPEFLSRVSGAPELKASERAFLREFMTGADLVKFARVPAASAALDDAIGKAELLVERTIPAETENAPGKEVKA